MYFMVLKQIKEKTHTIRCNFSTYRVDNALFQPTLLPSSPPLVHTIWLTECDTSLCRSFGTPASISGPLLHGADFSYFPISSFHIRKF